MRIQLRFLIGIIILHRLKLVLGNTTNACNCSCFLQPSGEDVCELIREVKTKTDTMVIPQDIFSDEKFTSNSELHIFIDERIKAYMEGNNASDKAQKKEETKLNEKIPNVDALFNYTKQKDEESEMKRRTERLEKNDAELERKYEELERKYEELEINYEELEFENKMVRRVIDKVLTKIRTFEGTKEHPDNVPYRDRIMAEEMGLKKLQESTPESRIEDIIELLCAFIVDTQMKMDSPSSFRTNLWISNLCSSKMFGSQKLSTPVTYRELEDLKATCPGLDSCEKNRSSDSLIQYNCQCGPLCSTFDTCCFDSPFQGLHSNGPFQTCQTVYGISNSSYFMVDQCPENGTAGDTWKTLCSKGEVNNFMTYVPVTSKDTSITYKNYYCFACHESTENYHFWEVKVRSKNKIATFGIDGPILVFNFTSNEWTGLDINRLSNESVAIKINKPPVIKDFEIECREGVISKCHDDWADDISRVKCVSYTSIIVLRDSGKYTPNRLYKNPHCALCNFENLDDMYCNEIKSQGFPAGLVPRSFDYDDERDDMNFKSLFSFTNFFTLTPYRCRENSVWNPFSSECSPLECSEGYSLKNRVCIPS